MGLVEQGEGLADLVGLEELEDVPGLLDAVGVHDPHAEVPGVVLVPRVRLELARAPLKEGEEVRVRAWRWGEVWE